MNVFLLTDLEGVPGVTSIDDIARGTPAYEKSRRMLTDTINRVGALCCENGAERVWYLDGHGGGGNVIEADVDGRIEKTDIAGWQRLLREGVIDCQIELGAHARAGTIGGFLDHTINSRQFFAYRVNGVEQSELSLHALVCGAYRVPVVLCIGDAASCDQAREYIPDIVTAPVKFADCRNHCIANVDADAMMAGGVRRALEGWRDIRPLTPPEPLTVELTYYRTDFCEEAMARAKQPFERVDARTLRRCIEKLTAYEQLKF
ncbi:MAG: M55 family metallopeptidase [Clostridia bacterium]|nr:M55 family metallopeptidase [Clostridia bacterium]